jgi:hypothetical protein
VRLEGAGPALTVLDAQRLGRAIYCDSVDATAAIVGFTLRGGRALDRHGNPFNGIGGAVLLRNASPQIRDCVFADNTATSGGALFLGCSAPRVVGCTFRGNTAPGGNEVTTNIYCPTLGDYQGGGGSTGGAIFCTNSEAVIEDCIFERNSADRLAGALGANDSRVQISRCTFVFHGAGCIYVSGSRAALSMQNSIIAFTYTGKAVRCAPGAADLSCCNLYSNGGGDWVECIGTQLGNRGNFSADPLFCDEERSEYGLARNSPCLPGHHPDGAACGPIGALGETCGPTSLRPGTWTQIKGLFR